jgi:hypothetical protein
VNSTTPAKFSYGFDFTVSILTTIQLSYHALTQPQLPTHSAIWIPVLHLDKIQTIGFNESILTTTGFTSTDPNLSFDFELSFRPVISASGDFEIFRETITFYSDIHSINLAVSQARNVTNDCTPASPGTDPSHIYKNLTHVVPALTTDFNFSTSKPIEDFLFGPYNLTTLPTQCLEFDAKSTSLVNAPMVSPTNNGGARTGAAVIPMIALAIGVLILG